MRFLSECYKKKGNEKEANAWLFRALAECPDTREPYLALAKAGYAQENWPLVFAMTQKALEITVNTGSYLVEPESWNFTFYDYGAISAYRMGMLEKSKEYAEKACELAPENQRLQNNLRLITKALENTSPREVSL